MVLFFKKEHSSLSALAALAAGALLLAWPALLNRYPLVFSDTHAFLVQAGEPLMVWDKPWAYGPFLRAFHWDLTLWGPLAVQALLLSHLLWLARGVLAPPSPGFHLGLCLALALATAAPWFASLLMPDILAPAVVLCLFALGFGRSGGTGRRLWLVGVAAWATATHLAFLPLAATVGVAALAFGARRLVLLPLAGALALLLVTNAIGHGRLGVSPYGAVFLLARLVADGPAERTIARACPEAGWHLCAWTGRLPADSDNFLWDGTGPVWSMPGGAKALAPEAAAIVARTLAEEPLATARAAARNTLRQLAMVRLGDTLGTDWLEVSITGSLRAYFPAAEMARFRAGLQMQGGLRAVAAPLNAPHGAVLILGALGSLVVLIRAMRAGNRRLAALAALVLLAVPVNAAASGALSRPNDRYQARIAWLLVLPPLLAWRPRLRPPAASPPPPATSAPASRSRSAESP